MADDFPITDGRKPCSDCETLCELDPRDMAWVCPACHMVQKDEPLPDLHRDDGKDI